MRYVRSAHFSYHNAHVCYIPTEKKKRKEMEVIQTIDLCVLPEKCVADVNGFVVAVVCIHASGSCFLAHTRDGSSMCCEAESSSFG